MLPMLGLFSVIYRDSRGDQLQRSTMSVTRTVNGTGHTGLCDPYR